MRTIERTTAFKRDCKREKKGPHGRQLDELIATVVTSLAKDEALAEALRDHPLERTVEGSSRLPRPPGSRAHPPKT
jgi:mRNA-degrading endonuclease YafQ of YafQ-DinJ toxin-antitoxin module